MDLLGPDIFSTSWMKEQVLHLERAHLKVPDWSLVWNELLTKKLLIFLSRLNEISGRLQLNVSFLKILNYSKTIQRLVLSFRNAHLFLVVIKTTSKLHFSKFSQQNKTHKINFFPSQSITIWWYNILPFTDIAKFLTSREVSGYNFYDVRLVIWILPLSGRPVPSTNADWK